MLEWFQNPVVAIGFAVGLMFFGYFFGLFEGRGQGYKRRQGEEAGRKAEEPAPRPPAPVNVPEEPDDSIPLLNLSRDLTGQPRLTLDGQATDPLNLTVEQRKRLIELLTHIRPWLESQPAAPSPAQPQPAPAPKEVAPLARTAPAPASPRPAPASAPRATAPAPAAPDENNNEPAAPQSIVMQINSILQAHLVNSPLKDKGIRLQESLEGGVIVWVGLNKYDGIEDVPDEQTKATIRAAISEWEKKYTPGL